MKIEADKNLLVLKGSVPGPINGMVIVKKAVKAK